MAKAARSHATRIGFPQPHLRITNEAPGHFLSLNRPEPGIVDPPVSREFASREQDMRTLVVPSSLGWPKSETRNPKSETNPKSESRNGQNTRQSKAEAVALCLGVLFVLGVGSLFDWIILDVMQQLIDQALPGSMQSQLGMPR